MLIATLAIIGFSAGVSELRQGHNKLGLWATTVCACAFIVNFI